MSILQHKLPLTGTIVDDHFQVYFILAQLRQQSMQNQAKLLTLEQQIKAELSSGRPDFREVECKIREFELTEHEEQKYVQTRLIQAASKDWMQRLDNQLLHQLLALEKIDQLLNRLTKLEIEE